MAQSIDINNDSTENYDLSSGNKDFIFVFYHAHKVGVQINASGLSSGVATIELLESNSPTVSTFTPVKDPNNNDAAVVLTLDAGNSNNSINIHSFTQDNLMIRVTPNGATGTVSIIPTAKTST